jgi:hypothetical protein
MSKKKAKEGEKVTWVRKCSRRIERSEEQSKERGRCVQKKRGTDGKESQERSISSRATGDKV